MYTTIKLLKYQLPQVETFRQYVASTLNGYIFTLNM